MPSTSTARITGFRRHALKKQVFPATVPGTKTDSVVGKVNSERGEGAGVMFLVVSKVFKLSPSFHFSFFLSLSAFEFLAGALWPHGGRNDGL